MLFKVWNIFLEAQIVDCTYACLSVCCPVCYSRFMKPIIAAPFRTLFRTGNKVINCMYLHKASN